MSVSWGRTENTPLIVSVGEESYHSGNCCSTSCSKCLFYYQSYMLNAYKFLSHLCVHTYMQICVCVLRGRERLPTNIQQGLHDLEMSGGRVTIKITVFRDVTPCSLVDRYQRFGELAASIFRIEESLLPKFWRNLLVPSLG
jgi:hypothetical protein